MPADSGSFGDWLRRQREMREISLRDIAERTKISLRYLEAMEADRFDLLPAPIFAKGFLREYARYVGLSPDEVVNHYLSVQQPQEGDDKEDTKVRSRPKPVDPGQPPVRKSWGSGLVLAIAGLILLALVALAAWFADNKRRDDPPAERAAPAMAAPAPAAVMSVPAGQAPPPEEPRAPLEVSLDFTRDCWVEVVTDGKTRLSELRVQGESLQLEAEKSVLLTLGNAAAVEVQVNGYPLPMDRREGAVVSNLLIDLETARTLKEKKEGR